MDIYVLGDIHGEWNKLNSFINKKNPITILQCGDFGFWPNFHMKSFVDEYGKIYHFNQYGIKIKESKIYWCPGNHENWWELYKLEESPIHPNIHYMKRGSFLTLPDGRNVLFMGGAESIDKRPRMIGVDWFPEETITQIDIYNLPDVKIDIVISHTSPNEFDVFDKLNNIYSNTIDKNKDPSRKALSYILKKYRPSLWYFGHYHRFITGYNNGCRWTCLNKIGDTGWWAKLPK